MKKGQWLAFFAAVLTLSGSAGFLLYLQAHQQLSSPGVKLGTKEVYDPSSNLVSKTSIDLPAKVLDYASEWQPIAKIVLDWLPKDTTYGQMLYRAPDGFRISMNAVLMGTDRTSIHDPKYCLTGQGWRIDKMEQVSIPINKPYPYELPAVKLLLSGKEENKAGETRMVKGLFVYWFVAEDQVTADHGERMLRMAWEMVRTGGLVKPGKLQRWAYITCFAVCLPGQEEANYKRVKDFVADAVPQFQLVEGPATKLAFKQ